MSRTINTRKKSIINIDLTIVIVASFFLVTVAFGVTLVSTLHSIVNYQENSAKYINVSGQQRMLSQRLALFSLMYAESGQSEHREQAQRSIEKIKLNLDYLLDESREDVMMSETLLNMYHQPPMNVKASLFAYLNAIEKIISVSPNQIDNNALDKEMSYILSNVTPILNKLDAVVQQYELESVEAVDRLKTLEYVLLTSFLFCSLAILFLIVIPWLRKNKEKHALLHAAASSDHLTKLLNRKALSEIEKVIFEESQKSVTPISTLMIDIDYFKDVNDKHGHTAGDRVLIEVSNLICSSLRESDYCFRYGGEEFLVILPSTDLQQAVAVAEKIKKKVNESGIEYELATINVTLSIGVSSKEINDTGLNEVIERADIAMYRAKNKGRNRIVFY